MNSINNLEKHPFNGIGVIAASVPFVTDELILNVDHCCFAWNRLIDQPWRIMSIGLRDWAHQ